jgi:archaellum component FlaC
VEDILARIEKMCERFDDLENKIGETKGMVKNLRKILIKLEVIDDRFIF